MTSSNSDVRASRRPVTTAIAFATAGAGLAALAAVLLSPAEASRSDVEAYISQAGRSFSPAVVTTTKGKAVTIVNDDGNTVHHAYVDVDGFTFDSGDQDPGDKAVITFPKAGAFPVMCGIHPKMRMTVVVE